MKYPTIIYAKALAEVISGPKAKNETEIVKNFLALVAKNGDESHLKKIVEEAARLARGKSGIRKVAIESARSLNKVQTKNVHGFTKKDDVVEERVNPELVAGVRVIINDELQFDGSLKAKLDKIFGSV